MIGASGCEWSSEWSTDALLAGRCLGAGGEKWGLLQAQRKTHCDFEENGQMRQRVELDGLKKWKIEVDGYADGTSSIEWIAFEF